MATQKIIGVITEIGEINKKAEGIFTKGAKKGQTWELFAANISVRIGAVKKTYPVSDFSRDKIELFLKGLEINHNVEFEVGPNKKGYTEIAKGANIKILGTLDKEIKTEDIPEDKPEPVKTYETREDYWKNKTKLDIIGQKMRSFSGAEKTAIDFFELNVKITNRKKAVTEEEIITSADIFYKAMLERAKKKEKEKEVDH